MICVCDSENNVQQITTDMEPKRFSWLDLCACFVAPCTAINNLFEFLSLPQHSRTLASVYAAHTTRRLHDRILVMNVLKRTQSNGAIFFYCVFGLV